MKYLFTIQGPEGDKTVQMALADPERFVLKPQLEGGGRAFSFITTLAMFKILKFFYPKSYRRCLSLQATSYPSKGL